MKRVLIITTAATLATIAAWILIRGELGFGGEMIIPFMAGAYAVITEEQNEEEPRA